MGLEDLAAGADYLHKDVKDIGMTSWEYSHDKDMQNRGVNAQKSLNTQMAQLSAIARRSSAPDMVEGLKRAGLHPALASGVGFGSVSSGGSAPSPSSAAYNEPKGSLGQLALEARKFNEAERGLMNSNAELNNANARLMGEQTTALQLANTDKMRYNEMVNGSLINWADLTLKNENASVEDKAAASYLKFAEDSAFSAGTLQAMNDWNKLSHDMKERAAENAENSFRRKLALEKDKNHLYEQIWNADKVQQDALFAQMNLAAAQRAKLLTDKNISEKELPYRIAEFKASINKLNTEAAKILHTDPAQMAQNKEWGAFLQYYFDMAVSGGVDGARAYLAGRGFSAGKNAGSVPLNPSSELPSLPQPKLQTPMQTLGY